MPDQTDALAFTKRESQVVERLDNRVTADVLPDPATRREIENRLLERAVRILVDRKFDGNISGDY